MISRSLIIFFFFQAEDGIRDIGVTGVQTCALPIYVALKERIPLVLCVREAPLNLIHIKNMAAATEAGAIIFSITPTFYNGQSTVESIVEEFAHKMLSIIGLKQTTKYEWNGTSTHTPKILTSQN